MKCVYLCLLSATLLAFTAGSLVCMGMPAQKATADESELIIDLDEEKSSDNESRGAVEYQLMLELTDGSRLLAEPVDDHMGLITEHGPMRLPLKVIGVVKAGESGLLVKLTNVTRSKGRHLT